jgi:catechol 2,3-dioxygenase-like lactoylglutathione lyase family enzyme
MKRLHVMLKVRDLEGSIGFYRTLFDSEPTVRRDDYAKWMLDDPRVNFSIGALACPEGCGEDGCGCGEGCACAGETAGLEHLGIQAETRDELSDLRRRVGRLAERAEAQGEVEVEVDDEGETVCCYARSDKTWVTDGQGVSWEMFHTHGGSDTYHGPAAEGRSACCA